MSIFSLLQCCAFIAACNSLRFPFSHCTSSIHNAARSVVIGKRNCIIATRALTPTKCDTYAEKFSYLKESHLLSYSVICIVGLLGNIVLRLMNSFQCFRQSVLLGTVFNRTAGKGLLTVSNHQSVLDDPGIWSVLLPFWRLHPRRLRWVLCTEDVFFAKGWLTRILALGRVLPLDRSGSMDQPMFQLFQRKLAAGEWCHIFPEGRVWQNWRFAGNTSAPILGVFKYGVGKLVAHCYPNVPIVLPIYHRGMSGVVPEKGSVQPRQFTATDSGVKESNSMAVTQRKTAHRPSPPRSLIPQCGNKIECYIGEPLNFTDTVAAFNGEHPGELQGWKTSTHLLRLYEEITLTVRNAVLKLEAEAYNRAPPNADAVQSRCEVAAAVTAPAAVEDTLCGARELVEL